MAQIILYLGGARSGKSRLAEARTLQFATPAAYIATAEAHDTEMAERIAHHQAQRGPDWRTHPAPLDVTAALDATDGQPRLVDCLTLWLSNQMLADQDWETALAELATCLARQRSPVVLVSNEVGLGIVPDTPLGRRFRDAAGRVNQRIASVADEVHFIAAGLSLRMK